MCRSRSDRQGRSGRCGRRSRFSEEFHAVIAQVDAAAFRQDADVLVDLLAQSPELRHQLQRFSQVTAVEVAQLAACNGLHQVHQRLARWLLMSQDRMGSKSVPLTQEFLALMLGTQRSSVTIAAGVLQRAGMPLYTRPRHHTQQTGFRTSRLRMLSSRPPAY